MGKNRLDLSAFDLKLLAMAAMLADHIGYLFFPQALWMRCVGRLAFPIFAFQGGTGPTTVGGISCGWPCAACCRRFPSTW